MAWSLLIVDDHPDFRRAARELLSSPYFVVVGEATGAADALRQATALQPELVLLDIKLPDGDGFAVAESLAELDVRPTVVLTSSHDATVFKDRLDSAPVRGFLPKVDLSVDHLAAFLLGGP
jgi:DNA-binding NarL/FixJ family response regulator